MNLNAQALRAQADLLRRLGYEADAQAVEAGDLAPHPDLIMEPEPEAEL